MHHACMPAAIVVEGGGHAPEMIARLPEGKLCTTHICCSACSTVATGAVRGVLAPWHAVWLTCCLVDLGLPPAIYAEALVNVKVK